MIKTETNTNIRQVVLTLDEDDVRSILYLVRTRQDDCRKIDSRHKSAKHYQELELNLETLKQRVGSFL